MAQLLGDRFHQAWKQFVAVLVVDPQTARWVPAVMESVRAGRQVTKVGADETLRVRGVDGYVKKVYSADRAILQFGHLRQNNPNIVTLDLSTLSRDTGTEVSGFLGFAMLRLLDVKLDYRDGLVDFEYNPNRVLRIPH